MLYFLILALMVNTNVASLLEFKIEFEINMLWLE